MVKVNGDHQDHHPHHLENRLEERREYSEVKKALEVGYELQEGSHQTRHPIEIGPLENQGQTTRNLNILTVANKNEWLTLLFHFFPLSIR